MYEEQEVADAKALREAKVMKVEVRERMFDRWRISRRLLQKVLTKAGWLAYAWFCRRHSI